MLAERGRKLDHVILMEVDEAALVERIAGRFTCAKCGAGYHDRYKRPKVEGVCDVCGSDRVRPPRRRPAEAVQTRLRRLSQSDRADPALLPGPRHSAAVDGMAEIDEVTRQIEAVLADRLEGR